MKKTKSIPAIVTLLGAAVAVIMTYINGYDLEKTLKVLLAVIFIFLFMGLIIKHLFEKYIPPIEEEPEVVDEDGSFTEKNVDEDGNPIDDGDFLVAEKNQQGSENV